ncbi:MAG: class I SAM-dependent methyltransferase [Planctomycetota bacterium]
MSAEPAVTLPAADGIARSSGIPRAASAGRAVPTDGAPKTCIACGARPRPRWRLRGGFRIVQCPRCLLAWWAWPPFDPGAFYDENYFQSGAAPKGYDDYAALEVGLARTARARLKRIARQFRVSSFEFRERRPAELETRSSKLETPRLLELGCGTGVFLAEARRAGWEVEGVEVSAYAAERARARGLPVRTAALEGLAFAPTVYDCVALWDVIEHLRDPAGVLAAAARALRADGVLALSTGDVTSLCARLSGPGWHLFNLPEHLFFFSPAALERLLRSAGLQIAAVEREVYWAPAAYLLERLRKSQGPVGRVADRAARLLAPCIAELTIPATVGDVLGVYATKT